MGMFSGLFGGSSSESASTSNVTTTTTTSYRDIGLTGANAVALADVLATRMGDTNVKLAQIQGANTQGAQNLVGNITRDSMSLIKGISDNSLAATLHNAQTTAETRRDVLATTREMGNTQNTLFGQALSSLEQGYGNLIGASSQTLAPDTTTIKYTLAIVAIMAAVMFLRKG